MGDWTGSTLTHFTPHGASGAWVDWTGSALTAPPMVHGVTGPATHSLHPPWS